ncbi:MAG: accessory regulator AgrB [Clostridium butyricum]|nr:accessory regulator AgrB [Clostridium butyricum]
MIGELSEKFVEYIAQDKFTTEETEEMKYIARVILYELIKMIGVILIFGLAGYFKEALIILIVMVVTRPYIGGYHEKTQMRCFIASMLFTAGELLLSKQCSISFLGNCILLIICIFAIYKGAPVINPKMPITRPELIQKNRIKAIRNSIILSVVSIGLYKYTPMYSLITWTLLIEVLMMFDKREK